MRNRLHSERKFKALFDGAFRYCFCCDSPSPPQADPNIGIAAANNAAVGKEALDFSKQVYADNKPRQAAIDDMVGKVLQSQLDTQAKSSAQADDYINYMKTTFRPVEQSLVDEANNFDTAGKQEELAGKAGADVQQAAAASDAATRRNAARYGINPNDGAMADNLASSSVNKTAMMAGSMNNARTAARTEARAFKFDVAGLGRGLPGAGTNASQVALQAGNSAVNNAGVPAANARADAGVMNAGFGTDIAGNASSGNLYSNLYQGQLSAYNTQQQAGSSSAAGLGKLAGTLGSSYLGYLAMTSSKKLKHRKGSMSERVALHGVKNLKVDRWQYKKDVSADQATHIGPYAEDFKKKFGVGDGRTISVIDALGVSLAAVKGVAKQVDKLERSVAAIARKGVNHGRV